MSELDQIRARAEAATEGPWYVDNEEQTVRSRTHAGEIMFDRSGYGWKVWEREDKPTAEFIAHARTDVPRLLAALGAVTEIAERHGVKPWTEEIFNAIDNALGPTA